jgi:hypothetical protein
MATEEFPDVPVLERLQTLGVALLTEWDALAFIYNHPTSLCTAAQIAQSIGYEKAETGAALQKLETLGLIQRSRVSQGIRFYRFSAPSDPVHQAGLVELMNLAQDRAGRVLLLKHLSRSRLEPRERRKSGLRLA